MYTATAEAFCEFDSQTELMKHVGCSKIWRDEENSPVSKGFQEGHHAIPRTNHAITAITSFSSFQHGGYSSKKSIFPYGNLCFHGLTPCPTALY